MIAYRQTAKVLLALRCFTYFAMQLLLRSRSNECLEDFRVPVKRAASIALFRPAFGESSLTVPLLRALASTRLAILANWGMSSCRAVHIPGGPSQRMHFSASMRGMSSAC